MIKPIEISQIQTTNKVYFECSKCRLKNTLIFNNRIINVDSKSDLEELNQEPCPNCNQLLGSD